AFYPVDLAAVNNYADDLTDADADPAKRPHRSQDAQARFLHRMMEIMYGVVEPEVYTWFYGRDPTAPGTAVIFPTFQTMGLREDLFAFDGMCDAGSPQSPENRAKASATGDVSKAAYCDWLRLNDLPYAPPSD
ncbi:MAG: hypothetical protein K8I02_11915, partial [Candidatus Methylomirabilis sp.]|nr:hypothetical protein [Deltaproteobacteria bacterium]